MYIMPQEVIKAIQREYEYQEYKYPNQKHTTEEWLKIAKDELGEGMATKSVQQKKCEIVGAILSLIRGLTESGENHYLGDCNYCSAGCIRNCTIQRKEDNQ